MYSFNNKNVNTTLTFHFMQDAELKESPLSRLYRIVNVRLIHSREYSLITPSQWFPSLFADYVHSAFDPSSTCFSPSLFESEI